MKIEADDPRSHVETITYTRSIVPGSVEDVPKKYAKSITFRPDYLHFTLTRHSGEAWFVSSIEMAGRRVTKKGVSEQRSGELYDLDTSRWGWRPPSDVVEYIEAVLESKRTEQQP